ncbi:hypothetical protein [Vulcanisaeta souniana]|uniref:hypothetical protein n=1 Tax=Vulcanisaeta souniana TaxID=164452 RepID=UPI000A605F93|nr:hypothetical protein [Vulcanisaeta souniana]
MIEIAALMLGGAIIIALSPPSPGTHSYSHRPMHLVVGQVLVWALSSPSRPLLVGGSMTFLGAEAREAHMNIRRGVIAVITLLSVFFIFMIYALIIGWGT